MKEMVRESFKELLPELAKQVAAAGSSSSTSSGSTGAAKKDGKLELVMVIYPSSKGGNQHH